MSHYIQIEQTAGPIKTETKRCTNLYTCISKLVKMRTEIRRNRTLPNDTFQEKFMLPEDFNENIAIVEATSPLPPLAWSTRYTTQLAFPPKMNLVVDDLPPSEDYFDSSSSSTCSSLSSKLNHQDSDEEEEEEEDEQHNYANAVADSYSTTLQKLSGIPFDKPKTNTAVLITLSPSALAAANAARQKRQKFRTYHH